MPWVLGLVACIGKYGQGGEYVGGQAATTPIDAFTLYLNGFHYASGDMTDQMEADHYCHAKSDGTTECVLYDTEGRLMGIEHVVPRDVFDALPPDEKPLWHPHTYEVLSGLLVAPDLDGATEHALMADLVSTYGKTWHVTEDGDYTGPALLMKGFTQDGQIDPSLVQARDDRLNVDTPAVKASRQDITDPGFDPAVLEEPVLDVCPTPTD